MRFVSKLLTLFPAILLWSAGAVQLQGQSVLARAEADPSVMTIGEVATYTIHFLNTDSIPNLNTPRVEGLEFSSTPSTSSYQRIENGRFSTETSMSWPFRATRLGSFTIPGRTVQIKGEEMNIPDVEVRVIEQTEEQKSRALLILELPQPPYYVGQSLQSRLILLGRRDLHISPVRLPVMENELFQHTELNNNQQRGTIQYMGRSYNAIVWNMVITPIKAGKTELQFRQDLELQTVNRDSRFPSIFSMASTQTEPLTVFSEKQEMNILSLPDAAEGTNFSGAIGDFEIQAQLSSTRLTEGEPVTLNLVIKGEGNFDRISPPQLPSWENWRIYSPKVGFEKEDEIGLKGTKSFEYILIPQSDTLSEVPAFSYATFNPQSASYQVTEIAAIPVEVEASQLSAAIDTFIPDPDSPGMQQRVPEKLLSLRPELGPYFPAGSILWKDPSFWIMNALAGGVLFLLAFWQHRRNRLRTDQRLARRHAGNRKIRKALQDAQHAAAANDPAGFYEAARFAIQESICHLSRNTVEAKSLVTSDCLEILGEADVSGDLYRVVQSLLSAADAFQFAGKVPARDVLLTSHKDLVSITSQLVRANK